MNILKGSAKIVSKLGWEKREFLFDIIENTIGKINTSEDYYRESLHSLEDYEFICNCCLEIFENNLKYKNSSYRSDREIGEKVYEYLTELKEWLNHTMEG